MGFLYSQLCVRLPYPSQSFNGQTVIVTGSNTGLGLEAARHFTRLGASKVILAVRSISKGQEAQKSIEQTTHRLGVCEVWQLDMEDFDSIKAFAKRAEKLERLDAILENAGVVMQGFNWSEKANMELTTAINVVGTFLLALLMLPILRKSGEKHKTVPHLSITSSEVHGWTQFPERAEPSIFEALKKNNPEYLKQRYPTSKLLEVFGVRALAAEISSGPHSSQKVILNTLNPGFCVSELSRNTTGLIWLQLFLMKVFVARSTEAGSRALFANTIAGEESHGEYLSDCVVSEPSEFVRSEEGKSTEARVYGELKEILEGIQPGITKNI